MTDEVMEALIGRLERKLGLVEPDEETLSLLQDELRDAEGELLLYLGWSELEEVLWGKAVELASIFYRRDRMEADGLKSSAYSEGQISKTEAYLTPEEYRHAIEELTASLARYRRVSC